MRKIVYNYVKFGWSMNLTEFRCLYM